MKRAALAVVAALVLVPAANAATLAPPKLSADSSRPDIASTYGSGVFGTWGVDDLGLPRYRYTIDEDKAPAAAQAELAGKREAWHQLGNDHIVADAFNHGYVQLWSQDRLYQWANYYEASGRHYSGGYGYLRTGGKTYSTLYQDRAPGSGQTRDFGVGYSARHTSAGGVEVDERTYAPFGDDPILLHDVTLKNTTGAARTASWFEYWDVNPYFPGTHSHLGLAAPTYDAGSHTLTVAQLPSQDTAPLSIYASALAGPVDGFETDGNAFFGSGDRAGPAEVAADHLSGALALPASDAGQGHTLFAFRAPVRLAPGQSVTLRYGYGMAHQEQIGSLVAKYRGASDSFARSQRDWAAWVPKASFGKRYSWLARELAWDAYMVRSGATYEECAGHHVISQGGYYQYDLDFQGAFRDPLQHMLPLIYADPNLAREVMLYSAGEQPQGGGQIPYARVPQCNRFDLGTSNDLDLWLLLSAAEYGLATRDLGFFDRSVPWEEGGQSASLWEHLKAAFAHQESQRGPHGGYTIGGTGDWSDFSTQFLQMTESTLVAAQTAYVYPRLAELADARGDRAFAAQLRQTAAGLRDVLRREWTGKGWYSRGYSGARQLGQGVIYGEPQPWALLAGVANSGQAKTLVANIRRFLTGIGAPGGPSPIGSSQSPAANDPGVSETSAGGDGGVGNKHAVYVGGAWYAINGWLTWALGDLDGQVPKARDYAFDEFQRNTLAAHTHAYPNHWDGVLSVDDACRNWYSTDPSQCGVGLSTAYDTQIMHQPAWSLFDAVKLAGVEPGATGYRIDPHLPLRSFSLRLPVVGVASRPGELRGYVRPERSGALDMEVRIPEGADARHLGAYAGGRLVAHRVSGGFVRFRLPAASGRPADWAVSGSCLARRSPIGPRNIGRVRLRFTRRRLDQRVPPPTRRTRRSWRWCVKRSKGSVTAAFTRKGRVALVATTARSHGNRGVRPGVKVSRLRRAYRRRRSVGRGLFRASPRSPRLIGVRRGRVAYVAIASPSLIRNRKALRRYLRLAGVERAAKRRKRRR